MAFNVACTGHFDYQYANIYLLCSKLLLLLLLLLLLKIHHF